MKETLIFWRFAFLCLCSGVGCAILSVIMNIGGDPAHWFWFGSGVPLYTYAFSDILSALTKWIESTPPFKGWRYWIKKTLNKETT